MRKGSRDARAFLLAILSSRVFRKFFFAVLLPKLRQTEILSRNSDRRGAHAGAVFHTAPRVMHTSKARQTEILSRHFDRLGAHAGAVFYTAPQVMRIPKARQTEILSRNFAERGARARGRCRCSDLLQIFRDDRRRSYAEFMPKFWSWDAPIYHKNF